MFIQRDVFGNIIARFANPQFEGQEYLDGAQLWVSPLVEIVQKESEKPFTHRALRELSKTVALMAQAVTGQDPLTNPEVAKIFQLDADIAALRDQAKVQGLI